MSTSVVERSKIITYLLNGTYLSLKSVVPFDYKISKPQLLKQSPHFKFGVLIGITGDVKGKLVLAGEPSMFGLIGESMYGMTLEGQMLESFSGELGNMIAGGLSTNIVKNDIQINITSPTIMKGETTLSGHKQAIYVTVVFENIGEMDTYFLMD